MFKCCKHNGRSGKSLLTIYNLQYTITYRNSYNGAKKIVVIIITNSAGKIFK